MVLIFTFDIYLCEIALHDQFISRYLESGENRVIGRTRRLSGKKKDGTIFPIQVNVTHTHLFIDIVELGRIINT